MIPVRLIRLPAELVQLYLAIRSFDWERKGKERAGCTASVPTLAEIVGKAERQTRANLHRLEVVRAIRREEQAGRGLRLFCTPDLCDLTLLPLRPAAPLRSTAPAVECTHPCSAPQDTPAVECRTPLRPTADKVDTGSRSKKQRQEVETVAGGSATAPAALVLAAQEKPVRKRKAKEQEPAPTSATWDAYATAYAERYHGHRPAWNAKTGGQLRDLLGRIPAADAPSVAAFYVWHNGAFYGTKAHPVGLLLADAEKLHMEWATGRPVNAEVARRVENTEANPFLRIRQEMQRREDEADVIESEAE